MKTLRPLLLAPLLAGCSIEGMAKRSVPEAVRTEASATVDEIMRGDLSAVREAFPEANGAEFEAALSRMAGEVREGREIARNVVGVQTNTSVSASEGRQSSYNLAIEVETPAGFTVVSQTFTASGDADPALAFIDVKGSDESLAAQIRRFGMAARIIGVSFLIGVAIILAFVLRRRRGEPAA